MTKMIKMSLIAAVAVTGMTSTVCAQPLEDAIKGVDFSGMMRYRYDETSSKIGTKVHSAVNNYRLDLNTKSKVNDIVTANVTVGLVSDDGKGVGINSNTNDAAAGLVVRDANFAAALGFATVIAGKQGIPGPFVDNTSDDVTRGTGAVALIPVGPVTLAAGHFLNHTVSALPTRSASELALITNVAGVNVDVWHATVSDALKANSIHASTAVAGVNVDARYSTLEMDSSILATRAESTLGKVVASTKVGSVTVVAGYAKTGKDNGSNTTYSRIAIDNDNDAQSDFRCWQASAGLLPDASAVLVGASMDIAPNLNLDAKYLTVDFGTGSQAATESLATLTYKMSKNFSVTTRYSMYEVKNTTGGKATDSDMGRLELKYTF